MHKLNMKYYEVTGKKFLSDEETIVYVSQMEEPYFKETNGNCRALVSNEKLEDPWINIDDIFRNKKKALEYAWKNIHAGLDGSYIKVETISKRFLSTKWLHKTICELTKENGEVIEIIK